MGKKFDIGDFLKAPEGVSGSNTEQIVLIDVDRIDPDPDNFYSLEGIDALAGNIELIGLQQPLRVRPNGERFTVVSGHRRRAAILMIRDGGGKQFDAGVPCIVEYGEASDAMRKLRLIYANAATRVMTSAEISRQAEEVTALLYELKEQGVEFPGRMREHVAEACKISASKLARLHAIRSNLDSNLLLWFDQGLLNEDAAYKLQQLPAEIQQAVGQELVNGRRKKAPIGVVVDDVLRNLDGHLNKPMSCRAHAGGPDCHHRKERIVRSVFAQYSWDTCTPGRCCMDCPKAAMGCSGACREAKDRAALDKAVEKEKREQSESKRKESADVLNRKRYSTVVKQAERLLPVMRAAGIAPDAEIPGFDVDLTMDWLARALDGYDPDEDYGNIGFEFYDADDITDAAHALKCSADFLLGLSDNPYPAISGVLEETRAAEGVGPYEKEDELGDKFVYFAWRIGNPPMNAPGWYAAKVSICDGAIVTRKALYWDGEAWLLNDLPTAQPLADSNEVTAWFELPEDEEV